MFVHTWFTNIQSKVYYPYIFIMFSNFQSRGPFFFVFMTLILTMACDSVQKIISMEQLLDGMMNQDNDIMTKLGILQG